MNFTKKVIYFYANWVKNERNLNDADLFLRFLEPITYSWTPFQEQPFEDEISPFVVTDFEKAQKNVETKLYGLGEDLTMVTSSFLHFNQQTTLNQLMSQLKSYAKDYYLSEIEESSKEAFKFGYLPTAVLVRDVIASRVLRENLPPQNPYRLALEQMLGFSRNALSNRQHEVITITREETV